MKILIKWNNEDVSYLFKFRLIDHFLQIFQLSIIIFLVKNIKSKLINRFVNEVFV